jgi:hypothetical protein
VAVRTVCDLFEEEYSEWTTVSATTATVIVDECETPTGLTVVESTLTTTSATLSWTENGDATEWEIKLTTAGVDSVCTANSNPYTVNGLRANSSYQVRVRAICSETEQSEWSAMTSFQTPQGVGIDGVDMLGVNLYPNPASSVITLEVAEKAEVTLIDQSGRECSKWSMVDGKLTIDVSTLATGTYYFRVVCTSGIAVRKLVVK